jgi:hypothetical protein
MLSASSQGGSLALVRQALLGAVTLLLLCAPFAGVTSPAMSAQSHTRGSAAKPRWPACPTLPGFSISLYRSWMKTGEIRSRIWGDICGPTLVIPGVNYSFTIVITNFTEKTYHRLTLHVSHYAPFTRSSRSYRREPPTNGDPKMQGAAWTVKDLGPGKSFWISFTLPFVRWPDPIASNFDAEIYGPRWSRLQDVTFVKP